MARNNLPTNFVNYELATSMGGMRRFTQIDNSDGTVSFEDATTYSTTGTTYGADEINTANELINDINELVGTTSISGSGQTDITSLLGGTDISESTLGLGDGTVTGAISELNSNLTNCTELPDWDNAVTLANNSVFPSYTAPTSGYISILTSSAANHLEVFYINGVEAIWCFNTIFFPVGSGDVITTSSGSSLRYAKFIPYKS